MEPYAQRMVVGTAPYQVIYHLQGDQLLLQFDDKLDDAAIDKFLRSRKLKAQSSESVKRNIATLRVAKMRWVILPRQPDSLVEAASELLKQREVVMVTAVYFGEGQGPESAASPLPDALVVRLREPQDLETLDQLKDKFGFIHNAQMSGLLKPFHYFKLRTAQEGDGGGAQAMDLLDDVGKLPGVALVELDWLKLETYLAVPTDILWANQWDMAQINLVNAWDVQTGSPAVWIAIIDSGFDLGHPDLVFTPDVAPNFTHFNAEQALMGNPPPYNAGPSGIPHGTACAGLAAATINNATGVAGVAGGCSVMPVRLGTVPSADRVAAGINWAAANGARVASLSLGTTPTAAATTAVANAWAAGMVLCAATGNSGGDTTSPPINFPANHANTIAVGASDQADQRKRPASADTECWGSQFGPEIDVIAPGVRCWSTDEQGASGYNSNAGGPTAMPWACVNYPSTGDAAGNYIAIFDGTSAATPHVAGLAGLLFSQYPTLTNQQVRDIIERTCAKVSPALYPYANDPNHPNGKWHQQVGYGRIDCNAALRYADLTISDHALDNGTVPSSALVAGSWTPAIFWGYQPYVTTSSNPSALPADHQPAVTNQDNYVHALVTNRGPATANNIQLTWHIMDYPGTQLVWPTDWNIGNQIASANIASLAPGASIAVEAVWPQASVNIAAGYIHPCMVVAAICGQDVGGDLSNAVYEYNNIAQHNISVAGFSAGAAAEARVFTMPFAVGHFTSTSRRATLLFDARRANGAEVFVDLNPPQTLPYVDRMLEVAKRHPPRSGEKDDCRATTLTDTTLMLDCSGCRTELLIKAGSSIRMLCGQSTSKVRLEDLTIRNAVRVVRDGREQLLLQGTHASFDIPLLAGQVVPMAVTIAAPAGAQPHTHFRVDVTQISEGVPTGGVTLDVETR